MYYKHKKINRQIKSVANGVSMLCKNHNLVFVDKQCSRGSKTLPVPIIFLKIAMMYKLYIKINDYFSEIFREPSKKC